MKCRKFSFAAMAGLGVGFCLIAGNSLDTEYSLDLMHKSFYIKWLICSIIMGFLIHVSWELCSKGMQCGGNIGNILKRAKVIGEGIEKKLSFPIIMLILLLFWMPVWLSVFPGVFSYDAYDEWMQICTGKITAHHPVLHVLYIGGIVESIYQLSGSYNAGIAVCTAVQMIVVSAVFAYTISFLRERNINPLLRLFAILFYGCSPVVQLFVISGTKDIFFTAAFLLFIISIYRICLQRETFFANKKWMRLFIVSSVFTMIMRNNGLYIVMLTLLIIMFLCRKNIKRYLLNCVIIIAIYTFYTGPFYDVLNVADGGIEEMLSVPLQQIARVYAYEKESIPEDKLEYLHAIIPEKNWEAYRSTVSDFVKSGFREEVFAENPARFIRIWVQIGLEHPLTYINSFLINTVDFWYPFAVIDGYQDAYGKSSYFDYRVSEPGTEVVLFPQIHGIYDSISHDKETQRLPGMFLLLSPGWYLIIFLCLFLYLWRERHFRAMMPLLPVLINFGTVLLGPIALVRYVLILFFAFPMYSTLIWGKE